MPCGWKPSVERKSQIQTGTAHPHGKSTAFTMISGSLTLD